MSVDNIIETTRKNIVEKVENNNEAHAGYHELTNIMITILIEY